MNAEKKKSRDKYLIDLSLFEIVKIIKQGGFGIVYLVRNKITKEEYAAKVNQNFDDNELYKRYAIREITIMMQIRNPTFIGFQGFSFHDFYGSNNITILMDFARRGSLYNMLVKEKKSQADLDFDNTAKQIIIVGIAYGMMLLHKQHIIHRDLTPNNILLDEKLHPHISDFGLSKYFNPLSDLFSQSKNNIGTAPYMSPEIINGNHYNSKTDVYSFGIILFEIICGYSAYPEVENGKMSIMQLTQKVCQENYRPTFRSPIKKSLQSIIKRCWSKNPAERPSFEELFNKFAHNSLDGGWDDYIFDFENSVDAFHIEDETLDGNYYYLDNVDTELLLDYVDEITASESMEDEQAVKKDEFDQMKNAFKEFKDEFNQLKTENIELKNQLQNVEKKLNSRMKKKLSEYEKENSDLKAKIDKIEHQMQEMSFEIDDLKKENINLKVLTKEMASSPSKISRRHSSKIESAPLSPIKDMSLPIPFTGHYFNGIMHYLVHKYGVEQIYSMIDISASVDQDADLINTIVSNNPNHAYSFIMGGGKKAFICYAFKTMRIKLTAYSIHAANLPKDSPIHMTDWNVETSNDCKKWNLVDKRRNIDDINDSGSVCTFVCLNPGDFCSMIRITNQSSNDQFGLGQIEFFGDLTI